MSDFKILEVDAHSHFLPEIDDGARNIDVTLSMINRLLDLGFRKLIPTPHVSAWYPNNNETILEKLKIVKEVVEQQNIPIVIEPAAEYCFDFEFMTMVNNKIPLLTFGGKNRYVLFEFCTSFLPPQFLETCFILKTNGYKPVLAHPERYFFLADKFYKYEELRDFGILFHLSINSLADDYGRDVRQTAQQLIKHNLYSFAGSDSHNVSDIDLMKTALTNKHFEKLMQSGTLLNATL